jgi:ribonuclease P protein component
LIREFFRLNKDLFPTEHDVVIMAKRNIPPLTYIEACKELTELFTRKANI